MTPLARQLIVAEARSWVRTPYRHQAHLKGVAVDCWGLVRGVGTALGIISVDPERFARFAGYSRTPNPKRMGEGLATFLDVIPADQAGDGDVIWIAWRPGVPMHVGILATNPIGGRTVIHAEGLIGYAVEQSIADDDPRIEGRFRFPGVGSWLKS
jgi:NlpC/P60 family putative phage cell wall peptidase